MLFKIGIEPPEDRETAYGLIIPALCNGKYTTVSAADTFEDIVPMARDAALTIMEEMALDGELDLFTIAEKNRQDYRDDPEYDDFPEWAYVDIDLDSVKGRQKRINISLSDFLIARIDEKVRTDGHYRDRSDFLAKSAFQQLMETGQQSGL
ncbi:hypothetical protein CI610_00315 [invertebrate metagenome]|uniref:HicB-like antitoxin of toxin-antitoxin system domain-containing protein n=1 Tax=invertebrate metagenome TaxID=1711999 RepID=A0A2H9TBS3_9ZZZZ